MRSSAALIRSNIKIAEDTWKMDLKTDIAPEVQCGQFVQVLVPGQFLRRPVSVCEVLADGIILVYRKIGAGTSVMADMKAGEMLDIFGPLGTGFPLLDDDVVLIGGGVGIPPLIETARQYVKNGHRVTAVLGFTSAAQTFCIEEMKDTGADVICASMDGSTGVCGTVMDAVREAGIPAEKTVLACGPKGMLKAVSGYFRNGYISLEERMACGIGACMGCVVMTPEGGNLRVCSDGPVFEIGKVVL